MVSSSGSHPENVGSIPARNEIYFPFFGSEERVFAVKPKPTRHSDRYNLIKKNNKISLALR